MPSQLAAPLSRCPAFPRHSVAELHSSTAVRTDAFAVICSPVPWRSTPLPLLSVPVQCRRNARPRNTLLSLRVVHQSNAAAILPFASADLGLSAPPLCFSEPLLFHAYLCKALAMLIWAKPSLFDSERCLAVSPRVCAAAMLSIAAASQFRAIPCCCKTALSFAAALPRMGLPLRFRAFLCSAHAKQVNSVAFPGGYIPRSSTGRHSGSGRISIP